jgi:hypothetical protein
MKVRMKNNSFKKGIVFYTVSLPIYQPYQKLSSPIIRCAAKRIRISGGDDLLNLEFLQQDGTDMESHSFTLPFSQKNIEEKLGELFAEFSLM